MVRSDLIIITDSTPNDYNFIISTWLRGYFYGNKGKIKMRKPEFMIAMHDVVDKILKDKTTMVRVARLKDDNDIVLGYAVSTPKTQVLHWIYVKSAWRGIGVGKDLLPSDVKYHTFTTKFYDGINKKTQPIGEVTWQKKQQQPLEAKR